MFESSDDLLRHYRSKGEEYDESIFGSFSIEMPNDRSHWELTMVGHGCAFLKGWSVRDSVSVVFSEDDENPIWEKSYHSQR